MINDTSDVSTKLVYQKEVKVKEEQSDETN